jgi:1-acyl-sn-glycerol-3-phosphate acyltransferase
MNTAASIQNVLRWLLLKVYSVHVSGSENIPLTGPVVVCANHSALIDGVILFTATRRPMRVVAKHELFKSPIGFLFSAGEGIPIDWKSPDRAALKTSIEALSQDKPVGIFPEGTRCRGQYDWLKDGVSYLIAHHVRIAGDVPIVPVTIAGTRETGESKSHFTRFGKKIVVNVGTPISASSLGFASVNPESRRELDVLGERLRLRLLQQVRETEESFHISMPDDDVSDYWERLK